MSVISEVMIEGNKAFQQNNFFKAHDYFTTALERDGKNAIIYSNLGVCCIEMKQWQRAFDLFQIGYELAPNHPAINTNLSQAYRLIGRMPDAVYHVKKVIAFSPDSSVAHSNLLLYLNYCPNISSKDLFVYHQQWGDLFPFKPKHQLYYPNYPDPDRPLRVAYISPDFRGHSVGYFIEPALTNYNSREFEIYCYAQVFNPDNTTRVFQQHVHTFRQIQNLNDQTLASQIQKDGIDILIDLAGHTSNSRLRVMTYQPAPIQITYLGYPTTVGLKHVDYRLTDAMIDPEGMSDKWHTEKLVRLDPTFFCFQPLGNRIPVSPLPGLQKKEICFGGFHNTSKIPEMIIHLWSKVLEQMPGAQLLLQAAAYDDPDIVRYFQASFEKYGIHRGRIQCAGTLPFEQYLQLHHQIDIMLDTQPWTGHTTSCHALWMGVPILTLEGSRHASRIGQRLMQALDLQEWVAKDHQDYVQKAMQLSQDRHALDKLRQSMRERILKSGISDKKQYVYSLEKVYRQLWTAWCEQKSRTGVCTV